MRHVIAFFYRRTASLPTHRFYLHEDAAEHSDLIGSHYAPPTGPGLSLRRAE